MATHSTIRDEETTPLLGGDAVEDSPKVLRNLWAGAAPIAQIGVSMLVGLVWLSVLRSDLILFSAHPLLNSASLLFITQAILVLQPTESAAQKRQGTLYHAAFNSGGFSLLVAGLVVIEVNKFSHGGEHFQSAHAILGFLTYKLIGVQALVGVTQYWTPRLYGGPEKARRMYKYHRMSGYLVLTMILATVCAAMATPFNENVLKMSIVAVTAASVMTLGAVLFGLRRRKLVGGTAPGHQ